MRLLVVLLTALLVLGGAAVAQTAAPGQGLSLYGELKYPPDFKHFDYVNPSAPKGGTVKYDAIGTFDTLNPFTLKGVAAAGAGLIFDTLLTDAPDEPVAAYGLIAESVEVASDRKSVLYILRKEARFHDGSPITPEDVIWTFDTLKAKGHPRFRLYYEDVLKAEQEGERGVRFTFSSGDNRELPQIVGEMPVLSKAYWSNRDFEKTTLEPPLGSGAYKIESVDPGRSITYRRVADYWGKDLPVNVGRQNFGVIRYDYYRDQTIALEAFKAGQYDIRVENVAKNWAIGYDGPALEQGLIKKQEIPNKVPTGMQAFVFNTRKALFADVRVRRALGYLFDFEWADKNLFYGAYARTESYFSNSDLASSGLPEGDERAILEKFKGEIPDSIFTTPFELPKTDGTGDIRDHLRDALRLLAAAGWTMKDGRLENEEGQPFEFEFLLAQPEFERIVLPFGQNLERAGIKMHVRLVDPAQFENRVRTFRLRHDRHRLGQIAVAGQRAARLLELGLGRRARQRELCRHQEQAGRRAGRSRDPRRGPRQPPRQHARARPRAAQRLLRHSQLAPHLFPRRALGQVRRAQDIRRPTRSTSIAGGSSPPARAMSRRRSNRCRRSSHECSPMSFAASCSSFRRSSPSSW